ncbi:unnamed protein product [Ectocarpus sp. CCAP 1310/34]|nr:unnamed protein product [Ectocarpus sp. CCAP 1310/34]
MSLPLLSVRANLSSSALGSSLRHPASGRCVRNLASRRRCSSDSRCNRPPTSCWSRRGRAPSAVMVSRSPSPILLQSRQLSSAASAAAPTLLFGDTIIVTKRCAERLNELRQAKAQPDLKLRLSVEGGGCSGFQYKFSLEDAAGAGAGGSEGAEKDGDDDDDSDDEDESDVDHEFERDGAVLVVDATSLEFVKGATVDFEEDMMRSAFAVLNNPVSESACGCGSSFALKNFEKNPALD